MTAQLDERLRRLAAWAVPFADLAFSFGRWVEPNRRADGVVELGWYDLSEAGQQFVSEMYELGWVYSFDWKRWLASPEGRLLSSGPEPVASASAEDLANLLTAIIRGERFADGTIEGAFNSGILLAIARRARELAESSA